MPTAKITGAEPDWLKTARAEGRVVEMTCGPVVTPTGDNVPTKKRRSGNPRTSTTASWAVVLMPACRVYPEANRRDHWAVRRRRFEQQCQAVLNCWADSPVTTTNLETPLTVTLTHVGRTMDTDNLAGAFKGVRDLIARSILGVDDGDERVTWKYEQKKGKPGIEIRIEPTLPRRP